ncbi:hypothetical protein [Nocardia arthritidis]|uniref:Uncharacterized protein n=1 Tax=Nocardia arthritidis TaxID=228602 RepID=A0A6G9YBV2_9NOCA|nr:hypothetical protein [Nocardia arthritidis]QIS10634.1 hypothetical protein F5544_13730 [Nocardia arthritidis]
MTSERNALALEWIAQQCAVPVSLLAELCQVSRPRAYELTRSWVRSGLVVAERMPSEGPDFSWSNELWVWLTRETAWAYLGFDPGPWRPRVSTAAHVRALAELRFTLTGTAVDPSVWTSERLLRHRDPDSWETGPGRGHVHDAEFRDRSGDRWAVEVELTRKKGDGRAAKVLRASLEAARARGLAGVVYFTRGIAVRAGMNAAIRSLEQAGATDLLASLDVRDLDRTLSGRTDSEEVS